MREKSKIDLWVSIVIWAAILFLASTIIILQDDKIIGYSVGIPLVIFLMWIYFGTYFEFREDYLYCRCGPFFEKIPYSKIKSVRLSQNFLSSMALSSKRIEIKQHGRGYITGTTFISPENREEFMRELIRRCKNLD